MKLSLKILLGLTLFFLALFFCPTSDYFAQAAFTTPYVWVVNTLDDTVSKIDSASGSVIGTYSTGNGPGGVAVDASGNVWITNSNDGTVTKINGNTGDTIGTYAVGSWPMGIAVDASGNIWVANDSAHTVTKLNGSTGETMGTYSVGNSPWGIAADAFGNIWVANYGTDNVTKLSSSTGAVLATYSAGFGPSGIAVDALGNVWVANNDATKVVKVNGSTGNYSVVNVGIYPIGIAIDASGNVWASSYYDNKLVKIDGSTGSVLNTYTFGTYLEGVAIDASGNVWTYSYNGANNGSINKFNIANSSVTGTYNVGRGMYTMGDMTGFALNTFVLSSEEEAEEEPPGGDEEATGITYLNLTESEGLINITEGQQITINPFVIRVKPTSSAGNITKVEFYIDDSLVCTSTAADTNGIYSCNWDTSLYHSLIRVVSYDSAGNSASLIRNTTVSLASTIEELPQTGPENIFMIIKKFIVNLFRTITNN